MFGRQTGQFLLLLALGTVHEYRIERRNDKQRQQGRTGQTADHGDTHRPPRLRACARTDRQRQHAQNGRERGHQHGTQTAVLGCISELLSLTKEIMTTVWLCLVMKVASMA